MKIRRLFLRLSIGVLLGVSVALLSAGVAYALDENQCLSCHGMTPLTKTTKDGTKVSLYVNEKAMNSSAHRYISCTGCHSSQPHSVDTPLTKLSLAEKCGTCHQYEYRQHTQSIHGQQLAKGNQDVATCVDCHSSDSNPHSVMRVLDYSAPAYKKNVSQTCAKCHDNETLMGNYGIVEKTYESYMRSFHGKAIQLGTYEVTQLDTATCTNCHGTHDIRSVTDPKSPVAGMDNLAVTCEQCHAGAGAEFARGFLGHKEASPTNMPPVHVAEVFFGFLQKSVIGFGALVVVGAVVRFSFNRWKEDKWQP